MQIVSDSSIFDKLTFNILGIDPGTDTIGFSIIKVNIDDLKIVSVTPWTEKVSRFIDEDSFEVEIHSAKYSRLRLISEQFTHILSIYNPTVVVSEAPFFNRFRPNAYAPLVETIFTLQKALHLWDDYKPLYMVDPPSVKKAVGAPARGDKDAIKRAIKLIKELEMVNFDNFDEHSIDATAVGYYELLKLRG